MSDNYLSELELLLSKNEDYIVDGRLNKNKIAELAHKYDTGLIETLASNDSMKKLFFVDVKDGVLAFNKDKFIQFINNKEFLPDSFTAYKNKIGLGTDTNLLSEKKDVVLNWAYKDCVLEGGQDKEDAKRDEIFHNTVLAPDQIDRLLDPKVLSGFKRFDKDGVHEVKEITDTDNLVIRGNNLLALHSIKNKFAGKVKLVYIDPPFNTGGDGFNYNDRFNHSTWLSFMRNRLEVARELLSEDGSIFIQCDENENGYLRVLCDEIFGREKFMNEIIWRYRTYQGQVKDYFPKKHDSIFWYIKNKRPEFKLQYQDNYKDTVDYKRWSNYIVDEDKIVYGKHPKTDSRFKAYLDKYIAENGQPKEGETIYDFKGYVVDDVWDDIIALDPKNATERTGFKGGQKPERLIERIISSVTNKGDVVLDYHLGSGTTCATAHKMERQYIGVEQIEYGENDAVERLKKVIDGEKGGISQSVNWLGGGSFVYCHLMDLGNKFIEDVKKAKTDKELVGLLEKAKKSSFLSYKVDPEKINPGDKKFKDLSIAHKKQLLLELVDQNHLYVNYSEIDDSDYKVTTQDKKLNKQFYG